MFYESNEKECTKREKQIQDKKANTHIYNRLLQEQKSNREKKITSQTTSQT